MGSSKVNKINETVDMIRRQAWADVADLSFINSRHDMRKKGSGSKYPPITTIASRSVSNESTALA
jgi:hypothetical protein